MRRPVAITAVGVVSALGSSYQEFARQLLDGVPGARSLSALWGEEARRVPVEFAAFISPAELSALTPRDIDVRELDRSAVFGLNAVRQIAGQVGVHRLRDAQASLNCGVGIGQLMPSPDEIRDFDVTGRFRRTAEWADYGTYAIAKGLGLTGTFQTFAGACSASTQACIDACNQVALGTVEMAIAGGHDSLISPAGLLLMHGLGTLSEQSSAPDKVARAFDRHRDGTMLGEGAAYLLFESLDSARARGAKILALVTAHASSLDGHHATSPDPTGKAAIRMVRDALRVARLEPHDIDYVNAHGTGTLLNDATECHILQEALPGTKPYVGSSKPQVGHLIAACGAIELVACVAAIEHQRIPPNLGFESNDPDLDVRVAGVTGISARVRHTLSNSFGFGGQNTCVIVSEAEPC